MFVAERHANYQPYAQHYCLFLGSKTNTVGGQFSFFVIPVAQFISIFRFRHFYYRLHIKKMSESFLSPFHYFGFFPTNFRSF